MTIPQPWPFQALWPRLEKQWSCDTRSGHFSHDYSTAIPFHRFDPCSIKIAALLPSLDERDSRPLPLKRMPTAAPSRLPHCFEGSVQAAHENGVRPSPSPLPVQNQHCATAEEVKIPTLGPSGDDAELEAKPGSSFRAAGGHLKKSSTGLLFSENVFPRKGTW